MGMESKNDINAITKTILIVLTLRYQSKITGIKTKSDSGEVSHDQLTQLDTTITKWAQESNLM
jgi:hypothetical protein